MTVNLNSPGPIDPNDAKFQKMLANLQGNILKGHGRDHSVHIFVKLSGGDFEVTRKRLAAIAKKIVTSAKQQHIETTQFRKFRIPGAMFGNLFLTARGYGSLGFTEAQIEAAFPEQPGDVGTQSNFREGMQAHMGELHDPPLADWEDGYREGEIDAMILLADDDEAYLLREARTLISELEEFSTVLVIERGNALRTDSGEGIEHFGYVDGRSQPIYFTTDLKDEKNESKEGKTDKWDPVEKLEIVLVPDNVSKLMPDNNVSEEDLFGSYFVFRKLEQDVRRFKIEEEQLADALDLEGVERKRAGAMAVGRFEDGTPLTLSRTDGYLPIKENDFTYEKDPNGTRCPFHAHIRKSNPRGETKDAKERSRRITRRGITYGTRNRHPDAFQALDDLPTEKVGLLFMCFQSSIANQFAFIQKIWVNKVNFLKPGTGVDPVIGQFPKPTKKTKPAEQQWPVEWDEDPGTTMPPATRPFSFGGFVTLKGGEFFFAPSIPFLRSL